ncbi:long-chain fatty acid--CoA ligase [bacterium]|nr:MAG: long-chain fatty acid--CoA ligase [bacterium]
MSLARLLQRAGLAVASAPAIYHGERLYLDFGALYGRAAALAGALRDGYRLAPGERVAIAATNCPQFVELLCAAWHAGLCVVPMNAKLHAREFAYILENSGARVCFVSADLAATVTPLLDQLPALEHVVEIGSAPYAHACAHAAVDLWESEITDPAWLFYTSGTTGRPKGATLCHRNLLAMIYAYFADVDAVGAGDTLLHGAPMSHGSGLYALAFLAAGAAQVVPESGHFDPAEVFQLLRAHRSVSAFFAPTMVSRLVSAAQDADVACEHIKTIVYGGGPMYVEDLKRALARFGDRFAQIYGQGEAPMTITALPKQLVAERRHPHYERRMASVGRPFTGVGVRVVDERDRPLPPGEIGEVCARGDIVMNGYWQNIEATAAALRGGWLHTGDVGCLDEEGFLTLKDRSKDMIISGGSNIYPREVEEVLLRHQGVLEASVVGRPHPDWGEEVVAFVVVKPGARAEERELDALCLEHIARFKRPKAYRFVAALPKNNYGKVVKGELRERLAAERSPSRPHA